MERFKTPAGRLSTIFYATDAFEKDKPKSNSLTDEEKPRVGDYDSAEDSSEELKAVPTNTIKTTNHRFAWKDLCLHVQVKNDTRQLLTNVSGKTFSGACWVCKSVDQSQDGLNQVP